MVYGFIKKLCMLGMLVLVVFLVSVLAESYNVTMGPFEVKFDTVQALDTRIEPPVAFQKFTGYPLSLWPKNGSDKKGLISLTIEEYNSDIDVSDAALRDVIKEDAFLFSEYPITYQPTTIDGRPGEVGTITTNEGNTVIFAAYSPDGVGISGRVLARIYASPFEGAPTENGDMFLKTLKIRQT